MGKTVTFAVGAMLLYTGWAFLAKLATDGIPSEQAVVYTYVAGISVAVSYVAISEEAIVTNLGSISIALAAGVFLGAGTLSYYLALSGGSAAISTAISGMYILGTAVLAIAFLDETLTVTQLAGLACAVVAVVLLSR